MIEVQTSPEWANAVLNNPAVRPDVADMGEGAIDVSPCIGNPNYLVLGGEHGIFFVTKLFEGVWEVHTAIMSRGRGGWAVEFACAGARHMFVATDCAEILTRVPRGHHAAATLTHLMGFRHQFDTPPECVFRGRRVPCAISSLSLQDWAKSASGYEDQGARFHEWLNRNLAGQPHELDPAHNRVVGVALDMIKAGRVVKGVIWYNRWAVAARHQSIQLISQDPVQIKFDAGILTMRDGAISLEPCH